MYLCFVIFCYTRPPGQILHIPSFFSLVINIFRGLATRTLLCLTALLRRAWAGVQNIYMCLEYIYLLFRIYFCFVQNIFLSCTRVQSLLFCTRIHHIFVHTNPYLMHSFSRSRPDKWYGAEAYFDIAHRCFVALAQYFWTLGNLL